ncbi:MAG: DUF3784 domain-containing protein [Saccharofermentanales bacterium]
MNWPTILLILAVPALLVLFAYLIRFRGMYNLISGYNTMSPEKKRNVDIVPLSRLVSNALFIIAGILLVGMLLIQTGATTVGFIVMAFLLPVLIALIVLAQKYDGNRLDSSGATRPGAKIAIALIIISMLVVTGFVGILLVKGMQPAEVDFADNNLKISGMYGREIPIAEIKKLELVDTLPKILRRTSGAAIGDQLTGHFTMEGPGAVMLYLNKARPPFILLETTTQKIYLNIATPEATRALFEQMRTAAKQLD